MYDYALTIACGIDPKTGAPLKQKTIYDASRATIKRDIKMALRIADENDAVTRYKWGGLPMRLTSQDLERILYYRPQLALFKINDRFVLSPFSGTGGLDEYGRFNKIKPVPFNANDEIRAKLYGKLSYDAICVEKDIEGKNVDECAVIIKDYIPQQSWDTNIARAFIQEPFLDVMADCIPFMRTNLLASTGVKGVVVSDDDSGREVMNANQKLYNAGLSGDINIPITGTRQYEDLASTPAAKANEYLQAFQALDNVRKSMYGIKNGGAYKKSQYQNDQEQEINNASQSSAMDSGLELRRDFANLANKLWGLNITVDVNEEVEDGNNEVESGVEDTERTETSIEE